MRPALPARQCFCVRGGSFISLFFLILLWWWLASWVVQHMYPVVVFIVVVVCGRGTWVVITLPVMFPRFWHRTAQQIIANHGGEISHLCNAIRLAAKTQLGQFLCFVPFRFRFHRHTHAHPHTTNNNHPFHYLQNGK